MTTHATASKQWTESELAGLAVENRFRLRGLEMTRLETFIDAAFAFALTLLVISFDEIPSSTEEMIAAVKRIPAFAASFATLMMFWLQHRRWSRRYGLENLTTVTYSLVFIFVVLVYVYPLRMIFEGMFSQLTGDFLPYSLAIESYTDLRVIFISYSGGFLALSLIICVLYRAALKNATSLALNSFELRRTRVDMQIWGVAAGFGVVSILFAVVLQGSWIVLAGYMYFVFFPAARLPVYLDRRKHPD